MTVGELVRINLLLRTRVIAVKDNPSGSQIPISWENWVNAMTADALTPCITKAPA